MSISPVLPNILRNSPVASEFFEVVDNFNRDTIEERLFNLEHRFDSDKLIRNQKPNTIYQIIDKETWDRAQGPNGQGGNIEVGDPNNPAFFIDLTRGADPLNAAILDNTDGHLIIDDEDTQTVTYVRNLAKTLGVDFPRFLDRIETNPDGSDTRNILHLKDLLRFTQEIGSYIPYSGTSKFINFMSWILGADLEIEKLWYDPLAENQTTNLTNEDSTIQRYVPESKIRNAGKVFIKGAVVNKTIDTSKITGNTYTLTNDDLNTHIKILDSRIADFNIDLTNLTPSMGDKLLIEREAVGGDNTEVSLTLTTGNIQFSPTETNISHRELELGGSANIVAVNLNFRESFTVPIPNPPPPEPAKWVVIEKFTSAVTEVNIPFSNFKGIWQAGTSYTTDDVVMTHDGIRDKKYWVSISASTSDAISPNSPETNQWLEVYCDFIKYNYTGDYSSSTTYKKNDVVTYTDSGVKRAYTYINDIAASGNAVTTTTHWEQAGTHGRRLLYDIDTADSNTVYPTSYVTLNIHEDDFQYVSTLQYKKFIKRLIEEIADISVVVVEETDDVAIEQDSIDVGISMREESETEVATQQPPYHIETVTGGKEITTEISEEVS